MLDMKRDLNLIKEILLYVENSESEKPYLKFSELPESLRNNDHVFYLRAPL